MENIRKLVISDLHGCIDEFEVILKKVNYTYDDQLIFLGDYVDRGLRSKQVIERIMELKIQSGAVALRGNHDDMMVTALLNNEEQYDAHWLNNGGMMTIFSYVGYDYFDEGFDWDLYIEAKEYIKKHYFHHIEFLNSLPLYYEDDQHIYVHAGINPFLSNWKNTSDTDFIWIRELFYNNNTGLDKKVIFGHTPTISLHCSPNIWFDLKGDKIGIDGGCAYGKQLNVLEITKEGSYIEHNVTKGEKYEN